MFAIRSTEGSWHNEMPPKGMQALALFCGNGCLQEDESDDEAAISEPEFILG